MRDFTHQGWSDSGACRRHWHEERCTSSTTTTKNRLQHLASVADAEINGLKLAVGRDLAEQLLKGCSVHWQRSCQHIADRIVSSKDKAKEKKVFLNIAYSIQKLRDSPSIVACFETLCGVRTVKQLLQKMPSLCSKDDADFIDKNCNWSLAKHWAQWWTRCNHLKMLSGVFAVMDKDVWKLCPSTTNAVERRNKDCKSDTPGCLKLAMLKVYKVDKVACLKHIAAENGIILTYRSTTEEAWRKDAPTKKKQRMKSLPDKTSQYGPPDRPSNFISPDSSRKRERQDKEDPTTSKKQTLYHQ